MGSPNYELKDNLLIRALGPRAYESLAQKAKLSDLRVGRWLYRQGAPIEAVYFPLAGMLSMLVKSGDRPPMEVALVGREGVLGAPEVIHHQQAISSCQVQLPARAVRVEAQAFHEILESHPSALKLMCQHFFALSHQLLYGTICTQQHDVRQRYARFLLMAQDRTGESRCPLTQKFVSRMLGVRRATVSETAAALKRAGLIDYDRGRIMIIDRRGLEAVCCPCYASIVRAYNSILPAAPRGAVDCGLREVRNKYTKR